MTATPVLETKGLGRRFGGLNAVADVSFSVPEGQVLGVIGPNGAGKSTFINLVTGHIKPTSGQVLINGTDMTGAKPWAIAHAGVARTFQIVKPFPDLPVLAIRYEDLLADTAGTFARALDFLGVRRTAGEAERAAHFAQFSELQRQESETGFRERVSSGAPFFRSGRAGAWRGQLPEESAAALVRAHGATMARLGYATDESIFERDGCRLA